MKTHRGMFLAVATAGLFVVACQGGHSVDQTGAAGLAGQTHAPGGAAGRGDRGAGAAGGAHPSIGPGGAGGGPSGTGAGGAAAASGGADAGGRAGVGGTDACTPLGAIPRRLFRLSAEQWGTAVQSVTNLPTVPVLASRGGQAYYGLFDDASLSVDASMLYDMYTLLDGAMGQIDPTVASTTAPCGGTTAEAQTTCATSFVQSFASRAYRRPITEDELSDLVAVYQEGATTSYNTGVELVMKAVLASPSFLFRTELGPSTLNADAQGNFPDTTLTPYEIASQLSFTLLGDVPDTALTAAAADGTLANRDGITTQINRLLSVPAARTHLTDVVLSWFGVDQVFAKTKDPSLVSAAWPTGSSPDQSAIQNDLWTSSRQFVSSILWSGSGKIDDLLTSQTVHLNGRLAILYPDAVVAQAPTGDSTFVAATWPDGQGRSGLLTQPAYLWAVSDPAQSSVVIRGKRIHDDVVCQDPLGSPVDLLTLAAQNALQCKSADGTQTLSTCDSEILKSDARLASPSCKVCHEQLDSYARVLQNFGPIGNYRTMDEAGRSIDPTGTFVPTQPPVLIPGAVPESVTAPGSPLAPRTLTGAQALATALISTGVFDGCAAQRMLGVAIGQRIHTYDTCELARIRAASDGTINSLFINLLSPDFMRARAGGPK